MTDFQTSNNKIVHNTLIFCIGYEMKINYKENDVSQDIFLLLSIIHNTKVWWRPKNSVLVINKVDMQLAQSLLQ